MRKVISLGDVGDDVAAVHKSLEAQGFRIPPAEVERKFFGPGTRAALGEFQRAKGIKESYEFCERTAAALAPTANALRLCSSG